MTSVVAFTGTLSGGGAEKVMSVLVNHWAEAGVEVHVVALLDDKVGYPLHPDVHIVSGVSRRGRLASIPYWMRLIRKTVKEKRPDTVLSFFSKINVLVLLSTFGIKTRKVVSERNDPSKDGRSLPVKLLTWLLYPKADAVVFQTSRALGSFPQKTRRIGKIIVNPIQVYDTALSVEERNLDRVVTVGRLDRQKNHSMLIEAIDLARRSNPKLVLDIYGEGPDRIKLEELIKRRNLSECVTLNGNVSDVHKHLADAGAFALSSDFEGLSNALMEAMSMGLPCVTTNCAGADDLVEDNVSGIIVPVGDPDAMARAIVRLVSDKELNGKIAAAAQRRSLGFAPREVLPVWDDIVLLEGVADGK